MSLNDLPSAERTHIAFFGRRNAGKSSVINAVTGQNLSIVSAEKGTTTDPVKKAMEILPLGPVVIIDTAGIDDEGSLGKLRVAKSMETLNKTDIAVIVIDSVAGIGESEKKLIETIKQRKLPYILCYNKSDLVCPEIKYENEITVSAVNGKGINELKELIGNFIRPKNTPILSDLISEGDTVVLVTPIDEAAPKGRLILPEQMVLREVLDSHAVAIVIQDGELEEALKRLKDKPRLVVCDSQVFGVVSKIVPKDVHLTSFSILMLRYKLSLKTAVEGAKTLDKLKDGDNILISEGCTHHRQCNDIGTVKLPNWIKSYTGKNLNFFFTAGGEFPASLTKYALVIHCGACMLNDSAIRSRMIFSEKQGVPFTNYGIVISKMHGILDRALEVFGQ
ncbi:MAG: [FeFe] hydrogenase H-cluster maturation GTPase HydF [Bacillota bacterium]|nr:[FeFe] hydrogenase H-cluster maturation GTPase HydF [Bacillota bacterium]